jgi:two-component system, LytTR family, sensor kinase
MTESQERQAAGDECLASQHDETGYRRPLPDRAAPAGLSINDHVGSTNGHARYGLSTSFGLRRGVDPRLPASGRRLLHDWPLALKSALLFWSVYVVLSTTRAFLLETPGQPELLRRRIIVALIACVVSLLLYLLLRTFARSSMRTKILVAALAALPASMLLAATNHYWFYLYSPLDALWVAAREPKMDDWTLVKTIAEGTHSWYFFVGAWAAIYLAVSTAGQLREADQRAALLAREAQEAQLRALRYQINPHFLFNTLNSLSSLVLANRTETAERMLMNLSAFFRSTLAADPTADVPLAEEIRLQQLYLEIEQVRFPERLKVEIDVPETLMGERVPVLILQPIVENSVKYGVARAKRPVTVRISARKEGGRLTIEVRDDGEAAAAVEEDESTGVGLRNVCERLSSRFGDAASCEHGPAPGGGYQVLIHLPVLADG